MTNAERKIQELPYGFTLQRPTMDDLAAVKQLVNACEIAEYGVAETTENEMRLRWQRPNFNMATDAWIVLAPDGQVVASAGVGSRQSVRIFSDVNVHPEYQRRGIGTYLLWLAEERASQHIPLAPDGARVVLIGDANSVNVSREKLLEKNGFSPIRNFWRMGIELREMPQPAQWAAGITVSTLKAGMEHAVFEADEEAFQDHWGHMPSEFTEWSHWAFNAGSFDPALWFLAMDGEEIAALALCADEKASGGWVHVLGVRRPWRRKGLGLALLQHAFCEFYRRNIQNVYLGVDAQSLTGATRLYERAGMRAVRQSTVYEKELRPGRELSTQTVKV